MNVTGARDAPRDRERETRSIKQSKWHLKDIRVEVSLALRVIGTRNRAASLYAYMFFTYGGAATVLQASLGVSCGRSLIVVEAPRVSTEHAVHVHVEQAQRRRCRCPEGRAG